MATPKYDADIPEVHAFVETRSLNPRDTLLRSCNFRIHARPKNGEAIWIRDGNLFGQAEAEATAFREKAAGLKKLQD
jgi:hypothetical protein